MFVVSDFETANSFPQYISGEEVRFGQVEDIRAARHPLVILDINLLDVRRVGFLRPLLATVKQNQSIACAVDLTNHRERTQAFALGATELVPRPLTAEGIRALMLRRAPRNSEISAMLESSTKLAGEALASAFEALHAQSNLEMRQIKKSGKEIHEAIAVGGVRDWLATVQLNHEGTFQHCLIVTGIATNFGHAWGMSDGDISLLTTAGLLHDIGKVQIPNEILDKPGKLTAEEAEQVRSHAVIGHAYLQQQGQVHPRVLAAVRNHHEFLDGSGYPDGLRGDQIDDLTRVLTICDIYGALIEHRSYKAPEKPEAAIQHLMELAGKGKVEYALVRALAKAVHVEVG